MNVVRVAIIVALVMGGCDAQDAATTKPTEAKPMTPKSHIPRANLQQMFDGIRQKTKWNIDGDMLWGYFFFDTRPDRLKTVQGELEAQGYRFVDLYETEQDERKTGVLMLHVEKIETHSIDSLDRRNGEFDALAARHGLQGYDGYDVGPVAPATQPAATRPAG